MSAGLILLILIGGLVFFARKSKDSSLSRTFLRLSGHVLLSIGLCGIVLIPNLLQVPALMAKQDPASSFLQSIGSDTPSHKTELSYSSPITELLYGQSGDLVLAGGKAGAFALEGEYTDQFEFLNEWVYSLWPYLPTVPFQTSTTAKSTPEFTSAGTVRFSLGFANTEEDVDTAIAAIRALA